MFERRESGTRQRRLAHDPSLQPRNRIWQQRIPEEDQPGHAQRTRSKMEYMQQYVKEQGDTPLCKANRVEKGTVTLEEEQGEVHSVGGAVRRLMFGVQNIVAKMAVEERIRSSRAPKPRSTDGPCHSFGEILWITRRQSQLESEPSETGWSNPSDDMDPRR